MAMVVEVVAGGGRRGNPSASAFLSMVSIVLLGSSIRVNLVPHKSQAFHATTKIQDKLQIKEHLRIKLMGVELNREQMLLKHNTTGVKMLSVTIGGFQDILWGIVCNPS